MDFSKHTILVVDDNSLYRRFLNALITKTLKAKVAEATNPKEAFAYLENNIPTLILLDMEMPFMDGFTALKHIRNNPATKDIPVVPCTAIATTDLIAQLFNLKISDYIDKKSNANIISQKLIKLLSSLEQNK